MADDNNLTSEGVRVLLVYGAEIPVATANSPGIRVSVDAKGTVMLESVGHSCRTEGIEAMRRATEACRLAGLDIEIVPSPPRIPHALVRRRGEVPSWR